MCVCACVGICAWEARPGWRMHVCLSGVPRNAYACVHVPRTQDDGVEAEVAHTPRVAHGLIGAQLTVRDADDLGSTGGAGEGR